MWLSIYVATFIQILSYLRPRSGNTNSKDGKHEDKPSRGHSKLRYTPLWGGENYCNVILLHGSDSVHALIRAVKSRESPSLSLGEEA